MPVRFTAQAAIDAAPGTMLNTPMAPTHAAAPTCWPSSRFGPLSIFLIKLEDEGDRGGSLCEHRHILACISLFLVVFQM